MADPQSPLALRVPDVAKALGITESNCRQMINRGQLPARKLGRRVIILADELQRYLASLEKTKVVPR
jgi:excisionase family DNA binding protein